MASSATIRFVAPLNHRHYFAANTNDRVSRMWPGRVNPSSRSNVQVCDAGSWIPEYKLADDYKDRVGAWYDSVSENYDNGAWHPEIAKRLIDRCNMQAGQRVLDLGAGTGISTVMAADVVGSTGRVVGVDISDQMLSIARQKVEEQGYQQIELMKADAETVDFPAGSFDYVLCSSAFIWMRDLVGALKRWKTLLAPGGTLAFHAFPDHAFVVGVAICKAAEKQGFTVTMSQQTGTQAKVRELLRESGFSSVEIDVVKDGEYMELEKAENSFDRSVNEQCPMVAPLAMLPEQKLAVIKESYVEVLRGLAVDGKVWNDKSIFYTFARNE